MGWGDYFYYCYYYYYYNYYLKTNKQKTHHDHRQKRGGGTQTFSGFHGIVGSKKGVGGGGCPPSAGSTGMDGRTEGGAAALEDDEGKDEGLCWDAHGLQFPSGGGQRGSDVGTHRTSPSSLPLPHGCPRVSARCVGACMPSSWGEGMGLPGGGWTL